ncbi:unnamed protein product [Paramecium primaurelia]|uniref:Uncharacterized protein n=1 Tax=Paramecium primaurelia TaxID=5886 RepID=A0A8S1MKZ8_PARPR|nr:unnamed protein product [Paramecium primaurelia]
MRQIKRSTQLISNVINWLQYQKGSYAIRKRDNYQWINSWESIFAYKKMETNQQLMIFFFKKEERWHKYCGL